MWDAARKAVLALVGVWLAGRLGVEPLLYGGPRSGTLWLGVQSDYVNLRLGAGKRRKIEGRRNRHRNVLNKIRRVHHRRSGP